MSNVGNRMVVAFLAILFSAAAFADLAGTVTLTANMAISLDTDNTSSSGGDLLWNGSMLAPQGNAIAANLSAPYLSGSSGFAGAELLFRQGSSLSEYSPSRAPIGSRVAGTNRGTIIGLE